MVVAVGAVRSHHGLARRSGSLAGPARRSASNSFLRSASKLQGRLAGSTATLKGNAATASFGATTEAAGGASVRTVSGGKDGLSPLPGQPWRPWVLSFDRRGTRGQVQSVRLPHDGIFGNPHPAADFFGRMALGPQRSQMLDALGRPVSRCAGHHAAFRIGSASAVSSAIASSGFSSLAA